MGGDSADRRLQRLKSRGFLGLSRIVPIDVNKAIYFAFFGFLFFLVSFGLVGPISSTLGSSIQIPDPKFLLVLSSVLALAVFLGAIIGGLRNLARAPDPPWAVYIPAALGVGLLSVCILWLAAAFGLGPPAAGHASGQKAPLAIGWVMPTFIFLAILLRGRCPMRRRGYLEFCSDVAMLAGVMVVSFVVMMVVGTMVGLPPPGSGDPRSTVLMMVLALAQGAGIGGLVLRPVRRAATMSVVIEPAADEDHRESSSPGQLEPA